MRILVIAIILLISFASADAARVVRNADPGRSLRLNRTQHSDLPRVDIDRAGNHSAPLASKAAGVVLNCENDGVFELFNTLALDPGDLAGTIYVAPASPNPFVIAEIDLGLVDFNASYPADVDVLILEDDGSGENFESIGSFTITIDTPLDAGGEVVNLDLREFNLVATRDLVILYGATGGASNALVLPGGDASPRCLNAAGDNICSVLLPLNEGLLYIYGTTDATACPRERTEEDGKILNFDIVMEVLVEEQRVAVYETSWGTLKSSY